jgi:hypothetical protein
MACRGRILGQRGMERAEGERGFGESLAEDRGMEREMVESLVYVDHLVTLECILLAEARIIEY